MMDFSVQVWLVSGLVAMPLALVFRLAFAGRSFRNSIEQAVLLTFAGVAPSVLIAVLLGPWMAVLGLCGFFWWQWRTVE